MSTETFARRRTLRYRRAMRIGLLVVVLAGCQPMYGDPAQKLKDPKVVGAGSGSAEPPAKKQYIDRCVTTPQLVAPAKGAPRNTSGAQTHDQAGQTAAVKAQEPASTVDQKRDLTLEAIKQYSLALQQDPYDADATLQLAVLYDRTLRKGCALVMLKRLQELSQHKAFEAHAKVMKEFVYSNTHLFADYRDEAMAALP
jgi:hypothetical protein